MTHKDLKINKSLHIHFKLLFMSYTAYFTFLYSTL